VCVGGEVCLSVSTQTLCLLVSFLAWPFQLQQIPDQSQSSITYFAKSDTYDHRKLKAGIPVRSSLHKQFTGGLVVRWVTTGESPLLYVFVFLVFFGGEITGHVSCAWHHRWFAYQSSHCRQVWSYGAAETTRSYSSVFCQSLPNKSVDLGPVPHVRLCWGCIFSPLSQSDLLPQTLNSLCLIDQHRIVVVECSAHPDFDSV
jgi:hypothetical protein